MNPMMLWAMQNGGIDTSNPMMLSMMLNGTGDMNSMLPFMMMKDGKMDQQTMMMYMMSQQKGSDGKSGGFNPMMLWAMQQNGGKLDFSNPMVISMMTGGAMDTNTWLMMQFFNKQQNGDKSASGATLYN